MLLHRALRIPFLQSIRIHQRFGSQVANPFRNRVHEVTRDRLEPVRPSARNDTYQCIQDVRDMFHQPTLAQGRRLATPVVEALPTRPTP